MLTVAQTMQSVKVKKMFVCLSVFLGLLTMHFPVITCIRYDMATYLGSRLDLLVAYRTCIDAAQEH